MRRFTDGAENVDNLFWTDSSGITVASGVPYVSPHYYKLIYNQYPFKIIPTMSECYFRNRIMVNSTRNTAMEFFRARTGSTAIAWLTLDSTFKLQAEATTIGVLQIASAVINPDQWYLIELYFKEAESPNGRFITYLDGNKVIDYTGDTKPSTGTTFDNIAFHAGGATNIGALLFMDDMALNDTDNSDGKNEISWCGDGIVGKKIALGNGLVNNWIGNDGNKVDNYLLVDEFPNDGDTTYVSASGTLTGLQDQYTLTDIDMSYKTILRIFPTATAKKMTADSTRLKLGFIPSGSGAQLLSALDLGLSYGQIVGDNYLINPVTSGAWTETDLNNLNFVMEVG